MTLTIKFYTESLDTLKAKKKIKEILLPLLKSNHLSTSFSAFSKSSKKMIEAALAHQDFKAEKGHVTSLILPEEEGITKLILQGLDPKKTKALDFEELGGKLYDQLRAPAHDNIHLHFDELPKSSLSSAEIVAHIANGMLLKSYSFEKYFKQDGDKAEARKTIKTVHVYTTDLKETQKCFAELEAVTSGISLTKDLVSEPPNVIYPETFANVCKSLSKIGIDVKVLNKSKLEKIGMNSLLAVSQGSPKDPYVVIMEYKGTSKKKKDDKPIAFVGKGVTFDTGGISLKPGPGMWDMKFDMAGAAVVTGLMKALALRKANVHAVGIIGLVENMPSGSATRPSDIVTSLSGKTIEILNTDAEGRLVLADILTYVQREYNPGTVIDLATLTGAIIMSLGYEFAGLFSNNDTLADHLYKVGLESGDKVWRLPLHEVFDKALDGSVSDLQNIPTDKVGAGSITAAQFLSRFIEKDVNWAHLDIAGTAWAYKNGALYTKGSTAHGVRLLNTLVKTHFEG
ncbi:MAG: leucyl aminopeptidase [Alphaproteobacteria bacterium]|nr:leucyl aminopeptidase [Alphaproteobacteria bacterium]MBP9877197.1 leucyl aminopeptidase [Alphaproteobacteria bacterium]